jgi:hypothetical protein
MSCKVCLRCKESKPIEDYHSAGHYNSKGERYSRASCKDCTLKVKRNRKQKIREWIKEYKMGLSCEGCGYSKETSKTFSTKALQFHHTADDKSFEIGNSIGNGYGIETIKKEIDKCVVLCSRCHAELHAK